MTQTPTDAGVTGTIARVVHDRLWGALAADAQAAARTALLDTIGCMFLGASSPECGALRTALGLREAGDAPIVSTSLRADRHTAALVNGIAAHYDDYDDYDTRAGGHPGVAVVPAALAAAPQGATGSQLLAAVAFGYEVMILLGSHLIRDSYALGYHSTGTFGAMGAAAAAGKVRGLDASTLTTAIGIGASQASGLRAQFGSTTKPFHAGHAAMAGVLAAELAATGFSASSDALGAQGGFVQTLVGQERRDPMAEQLRRAAAEDLGHYLERGPQTLKIHASCGSTHAPVDAALAIRPQLDSTSGVDDILIEVPTQALQSLFHSHPTTGLQGKFSAEYAVAVALLYGDASPQRFVDEVAKRDEVVALVDRARVVGDASLQKLREQEGCLPARVRVTAGGRTFDERVDHPKGSPRRPITWDEAVAKFRLCVAPVIGDEAATALAGRIEALDDEQDVHSGLLAALSAAR